jgi:cytochrome P450 family 142 subfamily A polypeptide 1
MAGRPHNPDIDLLDGHFYAGPELHRHYDWLRANAPVYYDEPRDVWGLCAYSDIGYASKTPSLFCSGLGMRAHMEEPITPSMINMDDPEHKRRRNLVNRGFTPNRVSETEPKIRQVVTELLDRVGPLGECDFVKDVAAPLPMVLIGDMLGVLPEDRGRLLQWSDDLLLLTTSTFTPEMEALSQRVSGEYATWVAQVAEERRAHPTDDLMSILVGAEVDGETLDLEGVIHESMLILIGGDETTRHVITGGMEALIHNPEQRQKLIDDPSKIPTAVEELLRWVSPIHNMARTTTRDVEIGGETIPEGSSVLLMYACANRDESVFEQPHVLNVERKPNWHVAFGGNGPHFCLGAPLARLELRIMFEELLRRLPDIELATNERLPMRNSNFITGIEQMPVRYTPIEPEGIDAPEILRSGQL